MTTILVFIGLLLVCLGMLLGTDWTTQITYSRLRRQAEERRILNEEWAALRSARRERSECPRCASLQSEWDWYFAPTAVEERPDDDCVVERAG
jgi:cell division protein FtsL